jgi:hypothetical protein
LEKNGVRQARYRLALALLDEGEVRVTEAVEQLDQAAKEVGGEPETWELLQLGARTMRGVTASDAVARYLRSLRQGAPDRTAHEAREFAESLGPGDLTLSRTATDGLLKEPTTAARRLLAATLLRSVGNSELAHAVVSQIDPDSEELRESKDVREPLTKLEIECLIDLGEFDTAQRLLTSSTLGGALPERICTLLSARLAFMRREFDAALELLKRLDGTESDTIAPLRNLAYVGAGRAAEVRWPAPDAGDKTDPDTWLSRAVAALASRRYDDAHVAASWAERSLPESLSVLLLKAQAHLESDALEPGQAMLDLTAGLAMLDLAAKSATERGREPFWLERQRVVRKDGRFAYVECEYERLEKISNLERIRAVDRTQTTSFQNGRLAQLEVAALEEDKARGKGPEWVAAQDRGVLAYTAAGAYSAALPLAEQVFRSAPSPARALALGRAAYGWSVPDDSTSLTADQATQVQRLTAAISAIEESLPQVTDDDLNDSLRLLITLKARHIELLERKAIEAGAEASQWAFANAIIMADNPWQQLLLEWFVHFSFSIEAASFEIAEYAAALEPSAPIMRETLLMARTNLFGADKETADLLAAVTHEYEAGSLATAATQQRMDGLKLRLALLGGDLRRARRLLDVDVGDVPWALELRALATIKFKGIDAAEGVVAEARASLRRANASKLTQALLAAVSGDHDEADALVAAAREEGNDVAADLDYYSLILQCARHHDRPLLEAAHELIARSRTQADLLWLRHVVFPALITIRGTPARQEPHEINKRIDQRLGELEVAPCPWVEEFAQTDAVLGALAALWRIVAKHDPQELASVLQHAESVETSDPLRFVLGHALRSARTRLAQ